MGKNKTRNRAQRRAQEQHRSTPSTAPAEPKPSSLPAPDLANPFLPKLRLLVEQGLLGSAYRMLCALAPVNAAAPTPPSAPRRINVLALGRAVSDIELALDEGNWEETLQYVEEVQGLWETADALAKLEGRTVDKAGRDAQCCEWTCRALQGLERWTALVDCAIKGARLDPPFAAAHSYVAVAQYKLGRTELAVEAAARADPALTPAAHLDIIRLARAILRHLKVGSDALAGGNYDLAIESATDALAVDPSHAKNTVRFLYMRASAYNRSGDPISALDDVSHILELRPADPNAFVLRARAYLTLNNPREALAACSDAERCSGGKPASAERLRAEEMLREKEQRAREREEEAARQTKQEAEENQRSGRSGGGAGWRPPGSQWSGGSSSGASYGGSSTGGGGPQQDAPPSATDEDEDVEDHYATLELHRTASQAEIRAAYLRLSRTAHPDKGGTHRLFVRIKAAYDVLVDPLRRRTYDSGAK